LVDQREIKARRMMKRPRRSWRISSGGLRAAKLTMDYFVMPLKNRTLKARKSMRELQT